MKKYSALKKRSSELGQGNRARREAGVASRRERREKTLLAKRRRGMVSGCVPAPTPATTAPLAAYAPASASTAVVSDAVSFALALRNLCDAASDAATAVVDADAMKRSWLAARELRQHLVALSDTGTDKYAAGASAGTGAEADEAEDRLRGAVVAALGAGTAEALAALLDPSVSLPGGASAAVTQQSPQLQQLRLEAPWAAIGTR